MNKRLLVAIVLCLSIVAVSAQAAHADDLCVGSHPLCSSPFNYGGDTAGLTQALAATEAPEHPGDDRVFIGTGTFSVTSPLTLNATQHVEIIGRGIGQTVIDSLNALQPIVGMTFADASSSIGNLTVRSAAGLGGSSWGLQISGGRAESLRVADQSTIPNLHLINVLPGGGTVLDGVEIAVKESADQSIVPAGAFTLTNSLLEGPGVGQGVNGSAGAIDHTTFRGLEYPIRFGAGTSNISDSLIDMGTISGANGLFAGFYSGVATVNAHRVTIVGSGPSQYAVRMEAGSGDTATFNITDSLVHVTDVSASSFFCNRNSDSAPMTFNLTNDAFDQYKFRDAVTPCTRNIVGVLSTAANPPKFADAANGDYRPTYDSPMIDAGSDGALLPQNAKDRAGQTRLVDGDNDGTARLDIGAFEYQVLPPEISATADAIDAWVREPVVFTATADEPQAEPLAETTWRIADRPAVAGLSTTHAFPSPGDFSAEFRAVDGSGAAASTTIGLRIREPRLSIGRPSSAFARNGRSFATTSSTRRPSLPFDKTDSSVLQLTLERAATGVRKGAKCVRGSRGKRCTRWIRVKGSQSLRPRDTHNRITFGGKFNGKRLRAGRYRVTVMPVADGTASPPPRFGDVVGPGRAQTFRLR